jgi:hypothetical protein
VAFPAAFEVIFTFAVALAMPFEAVMFTFAVTLD